MSAPTEYKYQGHTDSSTQQYQYLQNTSIRVILTVQHNNVSTYRIQVSGTYWQFNTTMSAPTEYKYQGHTDSSTQQYQYLQNTSIRDILTVQSNNISTYRIQVSGSYWQFDLTISAPPEYKYQIHTDSSTQQYQHLQNTSIRDILTVQSNNISISRIQVSGSY